MSNAYPVGWWNGTHFFNGSSWKLGDSNSTHFWYDGNYVNFIDYYISYRIWKTPYFNGYYKLKFNNYLLLLLICLCKFLLIQALRIGMEMLGPEPPNIQL